VKNEAMDGMFYFMMPEVAKDILGKKYLFASFSEEFMNQNNCVGTGYCGYTDSFSVAFSLQKFV
jgi:hypothetical protein